MYVISPKTPHTRDQYVRHRNAIRCIYLQSHGRPPDKMCMISRKTHIRYYHARPLNAMR